MIKTGKVFYPRNQIINCILAIKMSMTMIFEAMANRTLPVPDANTARVQEVHLCYGHLLCLHVEEFYLNRQTAKP